MIDTPGGQSDGTSLLVRDERGVRTLTLNRPAKRNALDDDLRERIITVLRASEDDSAVGALVLTGAAPAFCAGGDISAMAQRLKAESGVVAEVGWRRQRRTHELVRLLHGLTKPTLAAVNGAATGLGLDLALSCDFVFAAQTAQVAMSYVARGLIPDGGGAYFLPRRVGIAKAKELVFTGRTLGAADALAIGLVDEVVADEQLLKRAAEFLAPMIGQSALAVSLAKDLLNRTYETSAEATFASTRLAQATCYTSSEHRTAVHGFVNRSGRPA